jgi:putative ABC transport system permease protein
MIDAAGVETVVEDFEGAFRWDAIRTATRNRDTASQVNQGQRRGEGAAQFGFRIGARSPVRGLFVSDANIPIPALASENFLARTGAIPGSEIELVLGSVTVPLVIQGRTRLFPTMDDADAGFLIVDRRHLAYYSGLTYQSTPLDPTEVWLDLSDDPALRASAIGALREEYSIPESQVVDVAVLLADVRTDAIVRAGGSGVLLIALVAAFTILALGFALTLYLGGQQRTVELSVMRAVGLSPRQILAMISLEYLLIAVVGLLIGTIAGLRISDTMLSFLDVTEDGRRVLPPFALATRWDTVAIAFLATGLAFAGGVLALAGYFLRLPVSRILRLTR